MRAAVWPLYGLLVAAAVAVGGCVSGDVILHRMPPETPAAENAAAIQKQAALAAAKQEARAKEAAAKEDRKSVV